MGPHLVTLKFAFVEQRLGKFSFEIRNLLHILREDLSSILNVFPIWGCERRLHPIK